MTDDRLRLDRQAGFGARTWYFPDGDLPPAVQGPAEPHEALMIMNVSTAMRTSCSTSTGPTARRRWACRSWSRPSGCGRCGRRTRRSMPRRAVPDSHRTSTRSACAARAGHLPVRAPRYGARRRALHDDGFGTNRRRTEAVRRADGSRHRGHQRHRKAAAQRLLADDARSSRVGPSRRAGAAGAELGTLGAISGEEL